MDLKTNYVLQSKSLHSNWLIVEEDTDKNKIVAVYIKQLKYKLLKFRVIEERRKVILP